MNRDREFSDFVAARWLVLVRTALSLGCSLDEAEDLVQSTLLRAYVAWAKVMRADHRDAYVARMLVNAHRERHRTRRWRESPVATLPDRPLDDQTDVVGTAHTVARAVAGLSQGQREVVALRFYVRLTEPEIARALGIAPGTVKSRLSRALAALAIDADITELRNGGTA